MWNVKTTFLWYFLPVSLKLILYFFFHGLSVHLPNIPIKQLNSHRRLNKKAILLNNWCRLHSCTHLQCSSSRLIYYKFTIKTCFWWFIGEECAHTLIRLGSMYQDVIIRNTSMKQKNGNYCADNNRCTKFNCLQGQV